MNRGVVELARILRGARLEAGWTQLELARRVSASRSAIALMEQGRRLLDTATLHRVTEELNLPASLIHPFLSPAIQASRHRTATSTRFPAPFNIAGVSGLSGSGKTTLAQAISRTFGTKRIGSHAAGKAYLLDLQTDEDRWALEAQIAFLASKTWEILQHVHSGESIVVERWISEDIAVYERLFEQSGAILERGRSTFALVAELAQQMLPEPEYIFYCKCTPEEALKRTMNRARGDMGMHTKDSLGQAEELYSQWLDSLNGPEVYVIDTDVTDLTRPGVIESVVHEINWVLSHDARDPQLPLFPDDSGVGVGLHHLRPYHPERWRFVPKVARNGMSVSPLIAPIAYIAAPFTGQDLLEASPGLPEQEDLFRDEPGHGIIPRGSYRQSLLDIESVLGRLGFSVVLPHRDVNHWGRTQLTPAEAMVKCTQHVSAADLFVGILGTSCGSHYEFGLALSAGKACLLFRTGSPSPSFLAAGLDALRSDDVCVVPCSDLRGAAKALWESEQARVFLARHFGEIT